MENFQIVFDAAELEQILYFNRFVIKEAKHSFI